ncbi:MAG: Tol-Pal system beta propeller repeat protein TolB [Thermoanaerobaculia bacterium]
MNEKPVVLIFMLLALATAALGQQPAARSDQSSQANPNLGSEVTLELAGKTVARIQLAIPEIGGLSTLIPTMKIAVQELESVLTADLENSRIFSIQGPQELDTLNLTGDPKRDFDLYRSLQNKMLLAVAVRQEGELLVLEGVLYDLQSGASILGKRYRGTIDVARRIAHTFSDEIVRYFGFGGRQGISLTSIAFVSDRIKTNRIKEIFLMDYDGWNQRAITGHQTISLSPDWGPDSKEVAYVSYFSGAPGIYLADLISGLKSPVVTSGNLNISPAYSPDQKRFAFARSLGDGNSEIFVADRDGSNLKQLTHSSGIDTNPAWSPTGREIAFTSSRSGTPQIYIMDAEGASLRRITFEGTYNDGAEWSPTAARLVYSARRRGNGFRIASSDVVTLETTLLTRGQGSHESPTFSPDGMKIAYSMKLGGRTQIMVMDADGSNILQLTRTGNNYAPAWSDYPE